MAEFSLTKALQSLCVDPYPTTQYRAVVRLLRNITAIMQDLHEVKICCIDDIVDKLTVNHEEIPESLRNRFIPTAEVYRMLSQINVQERFHFVLNRLLIFVTIKLSRCAGEDAASILQDFRNLQLCVFTFRRCCPWDNAKLDDIILSFQRKLIRTIREFSLASCNPKFHLFSVIRVMIAELGKHPAFSAKTVGYLIQEVKTYYEQVPNKSVNGYVFENHLTYLYILNDLIGSNFLSSDEKAGKEVLASLKDILTEKSAPYKLRPREVYLVQNILRITELYQFK